MQGYAGAKDLRPVRCELSGTVQGHRMAVDTCGYICVSIARGRKKVRVIDGPVK